MSPMLEWVQLVDDRNRPCGSATRAFVRRLRLWHRATYVFVTDGEGRICVQRRTLTKDIFPGAFDLAAGGVVEAGEAMHVGAGRELAEELGITGVKLRHCFDFRYIDQRLKAFGGVFLVEYRGPMVLQESEVAAVEWMTPKDALALTPVTPDSRVALERLIGEGWLAA